MLQVSRKQRIYLSIVLGLLLVLTSCTKTSVVAKEETPPPTPQVFVVTQVITQIVTATPLPTIPPPPTTPSPQPTSTWDPLAAPIYYPLKDCVASRLHVGDRAFVTLVGGPNGIRYGKDIHESTVARYAYPGDILYIIDGPWCSWGWIIWLVRTPDGFIGFTPEGNGEEYWLLPLPKY